MAVSDAGGLIELRRAFLRGLVIPAHPLALTADRRLDERRQVALTRYYCDAGAGGVAVAVHTTQFEIRKPEIGLLRPVLELAFQAMRGWCRGRQPPPIAIAGVVGPTDQAVREAELAATIGYDAALLSLAALRGVDNAALLEHCRRIAEIIPVVGFYLQPAVGGRILDRRFWRGFLDIDRVVAVKVAPFDRYRTIEVAGALAESGRHDVALYTGNDDAIVADLLTPFPATADQPLHFLGGLLGQWAVGTRRAVGLLHRCHAVVRRQLDPRDEGAETLRLLALGAELTDLNAALFDPDHGFAGCIAGIHEVLRRQGLLAGRWTLNPDEDLSPGQLEAVDRVLARYPHLMDDEFIAERLDDWLA